MFHCKNIAPDQHLLINFLKNCELVFSEKNVVTLILHSFTESYTHTIYLWGIGFVLKWLMFLIPNIADKIWFLGLLQYFILLIS